MANILKTEKQIAVVSALAEGSSIRSIERITGIHRDTIMRLGVRVGNACASFMDAKMHNLSSRRIQVDEIWGFVGKKQKSLSPEDDPNELGHVYTFVALDADTKVVPTYKIGQRDTPTATAFLQDLSSRLSNRIQLSSDALSAYVEAVEDDFGKNIDYGQIVKTFAVDCHDDRRYGVPCVVRSRKVAFRGTPDLANISTSFIESQNLTIRMHCRRLTRLTNAFSKKIENFKAALGLHFAYYNFVKFHKSLRMPPAMAAGVMSTPMTVADLVEAARQ